MYITLKRDWKVIDASGESPVDTIVPPGRHEVERIESPLKGRDTSQLPWLVLKGTKIGGAERFWRNHVDHKPTNHQDMTFEIVIEE